MIYPASYDIVILQNSTWERSLRATDNRQALTSVAIASGFATFIKPCHSLLAGDKVVFTVDSGATVPCGVNINSVYFVIASGLTSDNFKVATTISGSQIAVNGTASGQYYVADGTLEMLLAPLRELLQLMFLVRVVQHGLTTLALRLQEAVQQQHPLFIERLLQP